MTRKLFFLLASLMTFATAVADNVSREQAAAKAQQLVAERVPGFQTEVQQVTTVDYEGQAAYHVVQFAHGGWAVIAADDMSQPLIGYSDEGIYQTEGQPENFRGMMEVWAGQVVDNSHLKGQRHAGWESDSRPSASRPQTRAASSKIANLIKVNWNQTGNYQKYCPSDANGTAVVGCVAVGMAQAMSVAQWPKRPTGEFSYNSGTYGYLYINYDEEPDYNWSNIISGANSRDDVARLLWHCGVAVRMDYGVDGSGTQTSYVPSALQRNFGYPASVHFYTRSNYSGDWEDLILTELREGRAVAYSGHDPKKNYGHCFNLDGYDGQWFHVNWGWGGANNGFFGLDGLRDAKMDMDYTDGQGVVVGVRAPSDKPSNILLTNSSVLAEQPAGTVVGAVVVESEAENPTYTFKVTGSYSVLFHTYLPAPFQVKDGQLVTTEPLSFEDYGTDGVEIEITATNNQNKASVTRHFLIRVTDTNGIVLVGADDARVVSEDFFSASGQRTAAPGKGLTIVRRRMADGTVKSVKVMGK